MSEPRRIAAGRIFASHYQIMISDDLSRSVSESDNWDESKVAQKYSGNKHCRLVGTEADLNDHWVELYVSDEVPRLGDWDRIVGVDFCTGTGDIFLLSVVDDEPAISAKLDKGTYAIYVCSQNVGVDQRSLGEEAELTDIELSHRKDLEWYRIFCVPGSPENVGVIKDEYGAS